MKRWGFVVVLLVVAVLMADMVNEVREAALHLIDDVLAEHEKSRIRIQTVRECAFGCEASELLEMCGKVCSDIPEATVNRYGTIIWTKEKCVERCKEKNMGELCWTPCKIYAEGE